MPKSATRVLRIMEYVAEHQKGCSHTQIANGLTIPKASLSALLKTMREEGYLTLDPETHRFSVGISVLTLANSYLGNLNLARMGAPVIRELFIQANMFSVLVVPQGSEYVIIGAESEPAILTHSLQIGHRGPLFCSGVGRAIMAFLPDAEVDSILIASDLHPITSKTVYHRPEILTELRKVRKSGLVWSNSESIEGISSVCAPVFDWHGKPLAAVGVAAPTGHFDKARRKHAENVVKMAAEKLSGLLGWTGSKAPLEQA